MLNGVTFEFDKATLTPNAKTILNGVADALLARKDINVEIDGYTDDIGSAAYNLRLSQRRADSVKQYLIGRGVDAARMTTKGFGEAHPIASNKTEEGRALNRRVELKIIATGNEKPATNGSSSGGTAPESATQPAPAASAPASPTSSGAPPS